MTLTEFLLARIAEDVEEIGPASDCDCDVIGLPLRHGVRCPVRMLAECEAKRRIVEWHANWPVLVEGPLEFQQANGDDLDSMTLRMTRQINWLTQQEYIKRFGSEPPTTPILRAAASVYADHPDYQQEWAS